MNGAITIVAGTTIHAINKANSPIAITKIHIVHNREIGNIVYL